MAYTTLYCNEQMLLDNWAHYNEPNMMLKNTLRKTDLSTEECLDFYMNHMRNRENVAYEPAERYQDFSKAQNCMGDLLVVNEINLYPQDFDYMYDAMFDYSITQTELKVLFGVIFMCRLFGTSVCSLDTKFKIRRFIGCYKEKLHMIDAGDSADDKYVTVSCLPELSDKYHLLNRLPSASIGCYYEYPEYEIHEGDSPEYTYKVTLDTNKLNLSKAFDEAPFIANGYCAQCERPIFKKSNAQKYCPTCADFNEFWRCLLRNNGIVKKH